MKNTEIKTSDIKEGIINSPGSKYLFLTDKDGCTWKATRLKGINGVLVGDLETTTVLLLEDCRQLWSIPTFKALLDCVYSQDSREIQDMFFALDHTRDERHWRAYCDKIITKHINLYDLVDNIEKYGQKAVNDFGNIDLAFEVEEEVSAHEIDADCKWINGRFVSNSEPGDMEGTYEALCDGNGWRCF